jgi:hypothetical protein
LKIVFSLQTALFAFSILLSGLAGCQKQEQPLPPKARPQASHSAKKETKIVIPPSVAGKWKAVRIAVIDKTRVSQKIYTIPVGGKINIPSSKLTISVETFLPAFIMEGSLLTSSSNELTNPGAKVRITEKDEELFSGWLFSKFPSTHAFIHPRYGFTLIDALPAGK